LFTGYGDEDRDDGMSMRRILGEGAAHYHCMSRIVGGERLLGDREKEVLRGMIWQAAEFCGVQVLNFVVMSNHFHVLVFVPGETEIDDEELVKRYSGG
jgi:putative transposase